MNLTSCPRCDGFAPAHSSACPHCAAPLAPSTLLGTLSKAALAVVSGSALSVTLMACYGLPPCESLGDADGDGSDKFDESATCYAASVDCNDDDATIHPGADDSVGDGIDQDCDGVDGTLCIGKDDTDGDGYLTAENDTCVASPGLIDCADDDATRNPGAEDTVGDGIDQNCDGVDGIAAAEGEGEGEGEGE